MKNKLILLICVVTALSLMLAIPVASATDDETVLSIIGDHLTANYLMDDANVLEDLRTYNQLTKNIPYYELIYERLFEYAPDAYTPVLATAYTTEPYGESGASYKIELRKDAVWHDGEAFTASDVVTSFNVGFLSGWKAWDIIDSISAPDDYTVIINCAESGPLVTKLILSGEVIAAPEHLYKEISDSAAELLLERDEDRFVGDELRAKIDEVLLSVSFGRDAVGTGVYKLESSDNYSAALVRNADSPFSVDVKVDRLNIVELDYLLEDMEGDIEFDKEAFIEWFTDDYVGDADGAILMDENLLKPSDRQLEVISAIFPDLRVVELPGKNLLSFKMNLNYYPFSEPIVRKAIQFLVNPALIAEILGTEAPDGVITGLPGAMRDEVLSPDTKLKLTDYAQNVDMAASLLAGISFEKQEDGFYQDVDYDVPDFEVIGYDSAFFYAKITESAEALSEILNNAGFSSDTYFYDRQDYDLTLDDGEWMIRFDITPYFGDVYDIYGVETDRVVLTDGTIVFLETVADQLLYNKAEAVKEEEAPETDEATLEREALISAMAVIYNDLAAGIPLGELPMALTICTPDVEFVEDIEDARLLGTGFEPILKLLRSGGIGIGGG